MSDAQVADFLRDQLLATGRLDDDVQTGHNGVSLSQKVTVLHQLRHGDIGESGELLLVFRVLLQEPEMYQFVVKNSIKSD